MIHGEKFSGLAAFARTRTRHSKSLRDTEHFGGDKDIARLKRRIQRSTVTGAHQCVQILVLPGNLNCTAGQNRSWAICGQDNRLTSNPGHHRELERPIQLAESIDPPKQTIEFPALGGNKR